MLANSPAKAIFLTFFTVLVLTVSLSIYFYIDILDRARATAIDLLLQESVEDIAQFRNLDTSKRIDLVGKLQPPSNHFRNSNTLYALLGKQFEPLAGPLIYPDTENTWLYQVEFSNASRHKAFGLLEQFDDGTQLFRGRLVSAYLRQLHDTWLALFWGGFAMAVPLLVFGYWWQKRSSRELLLLESACVAIGNGDLKTRLTAGAFHDELQIVSSVINSMVDRLERLVESLNELGLNIQHEVAHGVDRLDHKLQRLQSTTYLLENSNKTEIDQELLALRTECQAIIESSKAMLRLANIRSGELFSFGEVNLSQVVDSVADTLDILAEEKNIQLMVRSKTSLIYGDSSLLQLMVSNLISNAIKFSPEGGQVKITCDQGIIAVTDEGPGIPSEDRLDVFVPRRRLARDSSTPGHGYGLAISKAIAERHGGTIRIEDSKAGARFVVDLNV